MGMFRDIGNALNMSSTMAVANVRRGGGNRNHVDDEKDSENTANWLSKSRDIISKRFGDYFKSNYQTILRRDKVAEKVMGSLMKEDYADCLQGLKGNGHEEKEAVMEFIKRCCDICWIMVLQDPPLVLMPNQWKAEDGVTFDEVDFVKNMGSDRKVSKVLYYVWPAISLDGTILGDQKWRVIVRNQMYTQK